jgi:hypothetical protein
LPPSPGYTQVVTGTGQLAAVSGQIAIDGDGQLVGPSDPSAQGRQENIAVGRKVARLSCARNIGPLLSSPARCVNMSAIRSGASAAGRHSNQRSHTLWDQHEHRSGLREGQACPDRINWQGIISNMTAARPGREQAA